MESFKCNIGKIANWFSKRVEKDKRSHNIFAFWLHNIQLKGEEKKIREKITIYSCLLILTFTDKRLKKKAFLGLVTCPVKYSVNQFTKL